jgi:hypothetical protein
VTSRRPLASGVVWIVVAGLLAAGCATMGGPAETPITNFKQVTGAWTSSAGSSERARLMIQSNGRYWMSLGTGAAFQGQLKLEGGALRYDVGPTGAWRGKATLLDDHGKEYLRFTHDTGQVWMECEHAP